MKRPRFAEVLSVRFALKGGLDLVNAALELPPGRLSDCQNYEPRTGTGYRRISGYERSDGRASPTAASYWVITATISGAVSTGSTLTGATSGATGEVLATSGSTTIVLGRVSGTYSSGEALQIGGATVATATDEAAENGASDPEDHATYKGLAADDKREDITVVTGSGQIRGGFVLSGTCYAFRDNAGGTAGTLVKQTGSGWSDITFGRELQFDGAVGQISDGDTVTGATSGASGVVKRALLRTGTWTASGVGTLVFATITGTFQNNENLQVGGVTKAVADGADSAITRAAGGRIVTCEGNFTGTSTSKRIYGCDGVNLGFEFDGETYVPIRTGMTTDTPTHVVVHKSHLVWAFASQLQYSGILAPYSYSLLTGANEKGMGDALTGFRLVGGDATGAALAVFTSGKTSILYGSSSSDFALIPSKDEIGFAAYTMQSVGNDVLGLTSTGIQSLVTTQTFGNFAYGAVSADIQPLMEDKRGLQTASVVLKGKSLYLLFFSDNTGLAVGLKGNKVTGITVLDYGIPVRCAWSGTDSSGAEVWYFGSDDGYVYKGDTGTSFDGDEIEAWIRPAFNNLQQPLVRKQYRRAVFEARCEGFAKVNIRYDLAYGGAGTASAGVQEDQELVGNGGYWDQFGFNWDSFVWDTPAVQSASISIDGCETNIGFTAYSKSAIYDPVVLEGVSLLYTPRRIVHSGT